MAQKAKNKLIIELETEYPVILKDDILQVVKHLLKFYSTFSELFPPPALKDVQRVLNQIWISVKEEEV